VITSSTSRATAPRATPGSSAGPGHDGLNQRFAFEPLGDGYVRIVNQGSGKAVVVLSASWDAGAKIIQYQYESGPDTNDEWLVEDAGNGRIRLANRHSGLYLTAGDVQGVQSEQRRMTAQTVSCSPSPDSLDTRPGPGSAGLDIGPGIR
jgi:hypothetical protein